MKPRRSEPDHIVVPAPCWALTAWLLAPPVSIGPEEGAELRQSLMRRLGVVIVSAVMTSSIGVLAFIQHPEPLLLGWVVMDAAIASVRIPLIVHMIRFPKRAGRRRALRPWAIDLFVCVGTLWSVSIGLGCLIWIRTDDPGIMFLAALVAMGTIGAQGVRSPGTPRLNCVQMCLIMLPVVLGCLLSTVPLLIWSLALIPLYLSGMMSITYQLHADYVGMIVARTENRQRALHCSLTGLPNRASFGEQLAAAVEQADPLGCPLVVQYLDLDGFKTVNDSLGHAAGDALLVQVADRLRAAKRRDTVVARLGGDEFAILLRTCSVAQAEGEARSVIDALARPYDLGADRSVRIGVSIGLAMSGVGDDAAGLLAQADEALYAAKRTGKGCFRWYGDAGSGEERPGQPDLGAIGRHMRAFEGTFGRDRMARGARSSANT